MNFIHLRVASDYSLLRSTLKVKNIISLAEQYKMPAIGLVDYNSLSGVFEFSETGISNNIQPIIGYECIFLYDDGIESNLLLYAQNQTGLQNLFKLTGHKKLTLKTICDNNEGIIVLVRNILLNNNFKKSGVTKDILKLLINNFLNRLYIELQRVEDYIDDERYLLSLAEEYELPIVATHPVFFADEGRADSCDILRCISSGNYFADPNRQTISKECYFKSEEEMKELFSNLPDALENSVLIAKRCSAIVEESSLALPDYPTNDINKTLQDESYNGLKKQLECENIPQEYIDRLEYELSVIIKMNYAGYMLIVSDFIKWAKENDVPVGPGRGSGVGSLVAWSLLITDLDPIKFGLIFERFLNPERISMPDFDIDFCQEKRHLVIDYVLKKYGYVAHIITFGTLQARAVLRDVGRVLQIPYPVVDRICKKIPNNPAKPVTLAEALKLDPDLNDECRSEEVLNKLLDISLELEGLYRHASVHAAGIIISSRPFYEFIPVTYSDDTDLPVSQYAMKYTEKAGLVKFDFLGLKTLTIIKNTIKLLDNPFDISKIPLNDKKTYELLSAGKSIAVFQIESMFMQNTLRSLKPDNIEDIIALISLNRPGPLDNIPIYIERKHGKKPVDYIHTLLKEVLKETYGVIIYQEQVMKIAQILSGYSLAEADLLRRAMGKKIQSEMDKQCQIFIDGAKNNNVKEKDAENIFQLVAKFAGYGFNKSHAAAYAVISYRTAYLKAHYLVEFIVSMMNIDINDHDKLREYYYDGLTENIKFISPNISISSALFTVRKKNIVFALSGIKGIGQAMAYDICDLQPFKSLIDFLQRCSKLLNKKVLEAFIGVGAIDQLFINRKRLFESVPKILKYLARYLQSKNEKQIDLFSTNHDEESEDSFLTKDVEDWNDFDKSVIAKQYTGFYMNNNPMMSWDNFITKHNFNLENYIIGIVSNIRFRSSDYGKFISFTVSNHKTMHDCVIYDQKTLETSASIVVEDRMVIIYFDPKKSISNIRVKNIYDIADHIAAKLKRIVFYVDNEDIILKIKEATSLDGNTKIEFITEKRNIFSLQKNKSVNLKPIIFNHNIVIEDAVVFGY